MQKGLRNLGAHYVSTNITPMPIRMHFVSNNYGLSLCCIHDHFVIIILFSFWTNRAQKGGNGMKRSVKRTIGLAFFKSVFISICLAGLIPILYAFLLSVSSGSGRLPPAFLSCRKIHAG